MLIQMTKFDRCWGRTRSITPSSCQMPSFAALSSYAGFSSPNLILTWAVTYSATPCPCLAPSALPASCLLFVGSTTAERQSWIGWKEMAEAAVGLTALPAPPHPSSTEGCCKRSAHLCHCIIMMIISSNNNNLDVKLLQHLVLMEAASNSSLAGSCVGPPASRCCLNLRQKPEAWTCEDQEMCWPLTGHTGNSMTAVNPLVWSH